MAFGHFKQTIIRLEGLLGNEVMQIGLILARNIHVQGKSRTDLASRMGVCSLRLLF